MNTSNFMIFLHKKKWRAFLILMGFLIVVSSIIYVVFITNKLKEIEEKQVTEWLMAYNYIKTAGDECDITLASEILVRNTNIPRILVSQGGKILEGLNFGEEKDQDLVFLGKELTELKKSGKKPITSFGQKVYFKQSKLLSILQFFPFIQLLFVFIFLLLGFFGLQSVRISEQNKLWVGMAKETAHQLGTPISGIMGWINHIKTEKPNEKDLMTYLQEMDRDAKRLNLVAERFSKIGSEPKLEKYNIYQVLDENKRYIEKRAPRNVKFDFPDFENQSLVVNINYLLFSWVVENILKNALDSMSNKGMISASIQENEDFVIVNFTDTGKGIPKNKFKTIFEPGFSTKKRGWGLGLSLAKRIVENYHLGKIFVQKSNIGVGTTFTIKLPKL